MANPGKRVFERCESQVRSYCRQFDCIVDRANGSEIWDIHGRRYLDFLAGAGSLNYGHNHPVIKRALVDYIKRDSITHSLDLMTVAKSDFLEEFRAIVLEPRGLDYVLQFTGPTGTNAVEAAFKIARKATGRTNIVSFTNGFHGVSVGALAATGNQFLRQGAGIPLTCHSVMPYDRYFGVGFNTIRYFQKMLDDPSSGVDIPAAVIVEGVQGEGGLRAATTQWLQQLADICQRREILLILDDIQAGCGRTGDFFSFEAAGIKPDLVTLSKSLSAYGLPFSVVLIRSDRDVLKPGEHNGTFRGNNHAFITAAAALREFWRGDKFPKSVVDHGNRLGERLKQMCDRYPSDLLEVRGRGMMRGLVCNEPSRAAAITAAAFDRGLILERSGPNDEVIKFLMPLTTPVELLDEGLDIVDESLAVSSTPITPSNSQIAVGSKLA